MTNETQINNECIYDEEQAYTELLRQVHIVINQRYALNISLKMQKIEQDADFYFEEQVRDIEEAEANGSISVSVALHQLQKLLKNKQILKNAIINKFHPLDHESQEGDANNHQDYDHCGYEPALLNTQEYNNPALHQTNTVEVTHSVEQNTCSFLSKKVADELVRLSKSMNSSDHLLVKLGLIEGSDSKKSAFEQLKVILDSHSEGKTDPDTFYGDLREWKSKNETCIRMQRNKIHRFFSPAHVATSAQVLNDLVSRFHLDNDKTIDNSI